jgi:hypothetical protein
MKSFKISYWKILIFAPKRKIIQSFIPLFLGIILVSLVMVVGSAGAEADALDIQINGLYWADDDYKEYGFISESEPDGRGFLYANKVGTSTVYALVRLSYKANDNAFSNDKSYTGSVWWNPKHPLSSLIQSDHLEMFIECDTAEGPHTYEWVQDLVYDADPGLGYDWRSDVEGPDGLAVSSSTGGAIPASGIVITSHSSTEYNLENSSWITGQKAMSPDSPILWTSLDLAPLGTISTTDPLTDVTAVTGVHEDYPFFRSTGGAPGDLWEWEISYEMALDVSHCEPGTVRIGASSAHNSPPKDGEEDIEIPTAISLNSVTAAAKNDWALAAAAGFGFLMITTGVALRVNRRRQR